MAAGVQEDWSEAYVKRNRLTVDNIKTLSSGATIYNFSEENAEGPALMIADIKFKNTTLTAGITKAYSKAAAFGAPQTPVTTAINIKTDYDAKYGAPTESMYS